MSNTQSGSSCLCPGLAEEADLSWWLPQGQVPRPAQLSSLREPVTQDPTDPQATQMEGARSHNLRPMQTATAIRSQRWGWERGSLLPQSLGLALARALEPCRTQPPACSLGPPRSPAVLALGREGPWEHAGICLLPHFPPDDHFAYCWLDGPTDSCSLSCCLGVGSTAATTNG